MDIDKRLNEIAQNCRDNYHDDRWCPACEARLDMVDEIQKEFILLPKDKVKVWDASPDKMFIFSEDDNPEYIEGVVFKTLKRGKACKLYFLEDK